MNYNWGPRVDYRAAAKVLDDEWHHVAATYDSASSTKRIYVDGLQVGRGKVLADNLNVRGVNFRIGSTNFGELFVGQLDDVRVYDFAFSPAEVSALAAGKPAVRETLPPKTGLGNTTP